MAAPPPAPPPTLKPEIGADGLARDSPVIAYTEKVGIPQAPLSSSPTRSWFVNGSVFIGFRVSWLRVGWLFRRSFWRSSCSWRSKPFLCSSNLESLIRIRGSTLALLIYGDINFMHLYIDGCTWVEIAAVCVRMQLHEGTEAILMHKPLYELFVSPVSYV